MKGRIKEIVCRALEDDVSALDDVLQRIEDEFGKRPSQTDVEYIGRKYAKECERLWLQEVERKIAGDDDAVRNAVERLGKVDGLRDVPDVLKGGWYGLLVEVARGEEEEEREIVRKYEAACCRGIIARNASLGVELEFLGALIGWLNRSDMRELSVALGLRGFCDGRLEFGGLLGRILELGGDGDLVRTASTLRDAGGQPVLIGAFRDVIGKYIKPAEVVVKEDDGRVVLEVTGNVVVSEVVRELEDVLERDRVEEVRFIAADIVHVDADLQNDVWHGKNVVILTNVVNVRRAVTWDVSGKDDRNTFDGNAGTDSYGDGKRGNDGYPGESGGNVCILAETLENPQYFKVISNGGSGSAGQDAGNGKDGKDGTGVSRATFYEKFASVVKFMKWRTDRRAWITTVVNNIKRNSQVEAEWYEDRDTVAAGDIYIEAETNEGHKIIFSYYTQFLTIQAHLLYKGTEGKRGGSSGISGLGGQGGHPGKMHCSNHKNGSEFNISKQGIPGKDGPNGKPGVFGNHGKNGWDMGYTDYQLWNDTQYMGTNENCKLTLNYDNNATPDSVYCNYKKKYATITSRTLEHEKQLTYAERRDVRVNQDRQHHSQAIRKKNIPQESLLGKYSHHLTHLSNTCANMQAQIDATNQRALHLLAEQQKQQQRAQSNIIRVTPYNNKTRTKRAATNQHEAPPRKTTKANNRVNPKCLDETWLQLKDTVLNAEQLETLFAQFNAIKTTSELPLKVDIIERLLVKKCRFATFQEIAKELRAARPAHLTLEISAENAVRYLIAETAANNPILRLVQQHLNENVHRKDLLKAWDAETADKSPFIRAYILEFGDKFAEYYAEYTDAFDKHASRLRLYLEALNGEVSRERHAGIAHLWSDFICNGNASGELEERMKADAHLNALHKRFTSEMQWTFDWGKCCAAPHVLKAYKSHIKDADASSTAYREFLAHHFKVNIRLYAEDKHGNLFLEYNHNAESRQTAYFLRDDSKCNQMGIDKNFLTLEEGYKLKAAAYAKIVKEMGAFTQKQAFDDYLRKKTWRLGLAADVSEKRANEKEIIIRISEFFSNERAQQLRMRQRLQKMSSEYLGPHTILYNILERFTAEGNHLSTQEFYSFVNVVLSTVVERRIPLDIYNWIVVAHPQRNWINELILLQLETYFKQVLPDAEKWREYLSKIEDECVLLLINTELAKCKQGNISLGGMNETLLLLSRIKSGRVDLAQLHLSQWSFALKEQYWLDRLSQVLNWGGSEKIATACYYLLCIENAFGTEIVDELLTALGGNRLTDPDVLTNILSSFYNETWNLNKDELNRLRNCNIEHWMRIMREKFKSAHQDRNVSQLVEIIETNANTSKNILDKLPEISADVKVISETEYLRDDTGNAAKLSKICRTIETKKGIQLRDTQKLAVLALVTNNHTLAQVSTGEGKSLIVVAVAIMRALTGKTVHILTSSPVLAKRDAEENRDIYEAFHIKVSHNCYENSRKRKEAYSGNRVIYGDLSNFQRDYLLDSFYGDAILGDHSFENIIIDEVDSMLLDKGNNMLYLSHNIGGLDKLESVYIYIWQWITRPTANKQQFLNTFDSEGIKEAVLYDLYGIITKEDMAKIDVDFNKQQKLLIFEQLVKKKIVDGQGKFLTARNDKSNLEDIFLDKFNQLKCDSYKDRLHYLLNQHINRDRFINVPNHLKPFIEQHLDAWINSARTAFFMKSGQDYVVDVDKTDTSPDRTPNITILDRDTGTDVANSQWTEALHQFLQLKHGCKLSLQTLKAVFISNVSFFKLYKNLYGLTGTLGLRRERDLLKEIHNVDFVTIPTSKCKQFEEYKPIVCTRTDQWIATIRDEVNKLIATRSVLVICETVDDVLTLQKVFGEKQAQNVHTYTRDYEVFDIVQGTAELGPGQVIIATNLAGRGTDIKISNELINANGLHVCLTYLPNNIRIEHQAFGRAARKGEKGSGQLIILAENEQGGVNILNLRKDRDTEELHRVFHIKTYYDNQITVEEKCFSMFRTAYKQLQNRLNENKIPDDVKEIISKSCLDEWAFWLDENSSYISNITDAEREKRIYEVLNKFISRIKDMDVSKYKSGVAILNPTQKIKLGMYLTTKKYYKEAVELFNDVIDKEQDFSEAAHYYKAFNLAKLTSLNKKDDLKTFHDELRKTANILERHSNSALTRAGIISKIKESNNESIIQIDAYEEQQRNIATIYYMFSKSVDDIMGNWITPENFINGTDIDENLAEDVYEDLLREGVLRKPRVTPNIPENTVSLICNSYGISTAPLKQVLRTFKERGIDKEHFLTALKKKIQLPSCEDFWKLLLSKHFLLDEVTYISVDNELLKKIDPSMFDTLEESIKEELIKTHILTLNAEEMFLYTKRVAKLESSENKYSTYEKSELIKIVGKHKYAALKKKNVFLKNKKARLAKRSDASIRFPRYDVITRGDFTKQNITESETDCCIKELTEQGVIEQHEGHYILKIKCKRIYELQLSRSAVYNNAIRSLLVNCFVYRSAFEDLVEQLEDASAPATGIKLISKPHQCLFWDLLEKKVIEPAKVAVLNGRMKKKLKSHVFKNTMNRSEIALLVSRGCFISWNDALDVVGELVRKEWITQNMVARVIGWECYWINEENMKENALSSGYGWIEKTLRGVLENRLLLGMETTVGNVRAVLEQANVLKNLSHADCELSDVRTLCGQKEFGCRGEEQVFVLNGLSYVLRLMEKKWTWAMIGKTSLIIAFGLAQIVAGVTIELWSVGLMTHVGAACISEGVGDLMFSVDALRSGYFSWKSYGYHKMISLVTTAFTCGVAAYLSRGTEVSRFGNKLVGPNLEISTMTGTALMDKVGRDVVMHEVKKRIAIKVVQGIAFGMATAGVDTLVNNALNKFCQGMATTILAEIKDNVDKHDICKTLKEAYRTLGKEKARATISALTRNELDKKSVWEKYISIAVKVCNGVIQGTTQATQKMKMAGSNDIDVPLYAISKAITWSQRVIHIYEIKTTTDKLLTELDRKLKEKIKKANAGNRPEEAFDENEYATFKTDVVNEWKSLFSDKIGKIIETQILTPILKDCSHKLVNYAGKAIKKKYNAYKESKIDNTFKINKQEYQDAMETHAHDEKRVAEITIAYRKALLELLKQTKNPKLFADIIRENVPMDATCIKTCVHILPQILDQHVTIIVTGGVAVRQTISSSPTEVGVIVHLHLDDHHFTVNSEGGGSTEGNNNNNSCLYEALSQQMDLNMTPGEFRERVAGRIERDENIRHHISQGWHAVPISLGAFGGARKINVDNVITTHKINEAVEKLTQYQHSLRGGWKFNEEKDVDLRKEGELSSEDINAQLRNGFNKALEKINEAFLDQFPDQERICIDKFHATKYDTVRGCLRDGNIGPVDFPVEMKTVISVDLSTNDTVNYTVTIDLDNPADYLDLQGPHGPHVGYDIKGPQRAPKLFNGHVLLNKNDWLPDRGRSFDGHSYPQVPGVPVTRVFSGPLQPDVCLERYDLAQPNYIHQQETHGKKYPKPDY